MMAYETERAAIEHVVSKHATAPLLPEFSTGPARQVARLCKTLNIRLPVAIHRFLDRIETPRDIRDKMSMDLHGQRYNELTPAKKASIDAEFSRLHSSESGWSPAEGHPYDRPGFTFRAAHNILLDTYRAEVSNNYSQDLRAALIDFRNGLERDLDESAKHAGFFKEYSEANRALQISTAGPHRINQSIPMTTRR